MKILAIIPARGGSKSVPRKNIKEIGGKPLIAYTILEAKKSPLIDRVVVSTEDKEIANISRNLGAEIVERPQDLAEDSTKTEPVLQHALEYLQKKEGYECDAVILLPATCPFRTVENINDAIDKFNNNTYDTLISLLPVFKYSYSINENDTLEPLYSERKNRQDGRKQTYLENGAIYISRSNLIKGGKIFGERLGYILMDQKSSINIDEPIDFLIAKVIINEQ